MKNNFTPIILVIFGLLGGYLYYANISASLVIEPPLGGKANDLDKFENLNINFASLDIEKVSDFNIYGEYPVNPGITGKRNIFAPF